MPIPASLNVAHPAARRRRRCPRQLLAGLLCLLPLDVSAVVASTPKFLTVSAQAPGTAVAARGHNSDSDFSTATVAGRPAEREPSAKPSAKPSAEQGASASEFGSCDLACNQCFADHYQGCLAYCHAGCEDFCEHKLPQPACAAQQKWVAKVGNFFQIFDTRARMCRATGINGCPVERLRYDRQTPVPLDPYTAQAVKEEDVRSRIAHVFSRGKHLLAQVLFNTSLSWRI
mmetsp:Transcript_162200/g.520186  ORF Transcript_162200/g.520186 Transcript_162200/m.520186 type:complete len:230 (-) Transcript_162200:25-714(-)